MTQTDNQSILASLSKINNPLDWLRENESAFTQRDLGKTLKVILDRKTIPKKEIARKAGIPVTMIYQLIANLRNPSREFLLRLCVCMEATCDETNVLLDQGLHAPLNPHIKREAIILHALIHHIPLQTMNATLAEEGEKELLRHNRTGKTEIRKE